MSGRKVNIKALQADGTLRYIECIECSDTASPTPQAIVGNLLDRPNAPATTTSTPLIKKKKPKQTRTTKHLTPVLNAQTVQSKKQQQAPSPIIRLLRRLRPKRKRKTREEKRSREKDKNTATQVQPEPKGREPSVPSLIKWGQYNRNSHWLPGTGLRGNKTLSTHLPLKCTLPNRHLSLRELEIYIYAKLSQIPWNSAGNFATSAPDGQLL
jgi:hypothetical protein